MNSYRSIFLCGVLCLSLSCGDEQDPVKITTHDFEVTVAENAAAGQVLGTIEASTNRGTLLFALDETGEFSDALTVDENSGEVAVNDRSYFDFETNPVIEATVTVSNGDVAQQLSVTITLTDVVEIYINAGNFSTTIEENPELGQSLGSVVATTNSTNPLTYAIVPEDGPIAINATTGELTVANASYFNFELHPTVTTTAVVRAEFGALNQSLIVTITLTNDATETVQQRLDDGETPKQIYDSDNALLNQLYGKTYAGGIIATFSSTTGSGIILTTDAIAGGPFTQSQAVTAANNLSVGGFDDWRLPTQADAESICTTLGIVNNLFQPAGVSLWGNTFCCGGGGAYNFYFSNTSCGNGFSPVSSTMAARGVRDYGSSK